MVRVRLLGLTLVIEAVAYILAGALYAEKLGLIDVSGAVRKFADGRAATPGGGQ